MRLKHMTKPVCVVRMLFKLIGKKHNEKINIFGIKYVNLKLDIILKFNELTYYK